MNEVTESEVPMFPCLVSYSELGVCDLEEEYTHFQGKHILKDIETVYLYDRNQHTYCCEFSPSYYLEWVETRPVFSYSDDTQEFSEWRNNLEYLILENSSCEQNTYYHVSSVDSYIEANPERSYQGTPEPVPDGELREDVWEGFLEYYQCNQCL